MDERTRSAFIAFLAELEDEKFFGTVEFGYKAGSVYLIKKSSTILPEDLIRKTELITA